MAIPLSSWDRGKSTFVIGCTLSVRLSVRLHTETVQVCTMVRVKLRRGREYINHRSNLNKYESRSKFQWWKWERWRLKPPVTRMLVQQFVHANNCTNTKPPHQFPHVNGNHRCLVGSTNKGQVMTSSILTKMFVCMGGSLCAVCDACEFDDDLIRH